MQAIFIVEETDARLRLIETWGVCYARIGTQSQSFQKSEYLFMGPHIDLPTYWVVALGLGLRAHGLLLLSLAHQVLN